MNRNFVWGAPSSMAVGEFEKDFTIDILPFVENHYRTLNDRDHRAIAGLSMGGMQTLNITMADPKKFAYIGVFSSGWISGLRIQCGKTIRFRTGRYLSEKGYPIDMVCHRQG